MEQLSLVCLVLVAGIVTAGIAGSIFELVADARLSFATPFFSREHLARSMSAALTAGPLMLFNDGLDALKAKRVGWATLAGIGISVLVWLFALGHTVLVVMLWFA